MKCGAVLLSSQATSLIGWRGGIVNRSRLNNRSTHLGLSLRRSPHCICSLHQDLQLSTLLFSLIACIVLRCNVFWILEFEEMFEMGGSGAYYLGFGTGVQDLRFWKYNFFWKDSYRVSTSVAPRGSHLPIMRVATPWAPKMIIMSCSSLKMQYISLEIWILKGPLKWEGPRTLSY